MGNVAAHHPQGSFVALTKSLQGEWTFCQRVIEDSDSYFIPLREKICKFFLPSLFGSEVSELEAKLFCRPARYGGLGIHDPVINASTQFTASKSATFLLSKAIYEASELDLNEHEQIYLSSLSQKKELEKNWKNDTFALIDHFPEPNKRCVLRKMEFQCSGWLSVVPVEGNHFEMSPIEFRDAIALRYGRIPIDLPLSCDADGQIFDVNHALNCPRGGLVYGRHNELRDLNCSLLELAGMKQISIVSER